MLAASRLKLCGAAILVAICRSNSMATVLTFDVALPITESENIDQRYGDRVSQVNMPFNFQYGQQGEGFTRTSTVDYGPLSPVNADPALRTTGFGDLTNVLIKDNDSAPTLRIAFTAPLSPNPTISSETVVLHGWDMAALTSAFTSDPVINSIRVLGPGTNGTQWFSATNVSISRTTHTHFVFPQPIVDFQLILEIDLANLGTLSDEIGIDNIIFSQNPEPSTAMMLIIAIVGPLLTRRHKSSASH